ncbi:MULTISPECIES: lipid A biosynthesis lauroyl acyltransferase [Cupriavidus]|uniref:lipid A biosynthesis lauroyl acyltransferase n=1 Tax=Cupriavidus sp. DF5525 TaxID=3160989 RepID=UPI0003B01EDC|nr:lauroyl acyltransferase [Ralstonia pickettii DTP0602]
MTQRLQAALTIALFKLLAALPYGVTARLGDGLGKLLYRIPSRRRRIVLTNLKLCFPDMDEDTRQNLARNHFGHVLRSYLERGIQWFGSAERLGKLVELDTRIDLASCTEQPTIFMGFHFVGIEAGCMFYSMRHPVASLYTRMSSPMLDEISRTQRGRFGAEMIPRSGSGKQVVRTLRAGCPVMLAADMDFGVTDSVFVPFFGVPACTLTSASRLASMTGARVVPFTTEVLPNYRGYRLRVFDALEGFPSGSVEEDSRRMNAFLETQIATMPEQYYWVHRRFKNRPAGMVPVY